MSAKLTKRELSKVIESLGFSELAIREGCAPYTVKQESLEEISVIKAKLSAMRKEKK